ncbi:hypothetical protein [Streptomyces sp. NPDC126499]|uniref:hypothetical protein n=1 Tax=Streptomyces sp. NPDC126499 TaxID=3155314 RepID=UPI00332D7852
MFDNTSHTSSMAERQGTMTSQTGGSGAQTTLQDHLNALLQSPGPVDKRALLALLDAEVAAREIHAYKAGWNDAVVELRRVS